MTRHLIAALIASVCLCGAAQAQQRPMPGYQDDERYAQPTASDDDVSSRDARRDDGYPANYGDPSTRRPADRQDGYTGYNDVPPPASRYPAEDAAHRADRLRTAELNHRAYARPSDAGGGRSQSDYARQSEQYRAQLADHERALRSYDDDRARYADRIARWRARASACEAGDLDACQGPE